MTYGKFFTGGWWRGVALLVAAGGLFSVGLSRAWAQAADHSEPLYAYTLIEAATGLTNENQDSVQSLMLDGWYGGDRNRLWWQADADWQAGVQKGSGIAAWYGHYFAPFWDAQVGLRSEGYPGSAHYLSVGVRGLAPYEYDTDIKLDLRRDGKALLHAHFEQEWLLTNRLILRPSLAVALSGSDVDATVRKGLYQANMAAQLRYEFSRKTAAFAEISRAMYLRTTAAGESDATHFALGLRLVF
jgi:copper resistance protein B